MIDRSAAALASILLAGSVSFPAAAAQSRGIIWVKDETTPSVVVNWCDVTSSLEDRLRCYPDGKAPAVELDSAAKKSQDQLSRVLDGQSVKITVTHLNAFAYDLSFTPEYKVIESYVALNNAVNQLLTGGGLFKMLGVSSKSFDDMASWNSLLEGTSRWATNTTRYWKNDVGEALTDDDIGRQPGGLPPPVDTKGGGEDATKTLLVLIAKLDVMQEVLAKARSKAQSSMIKENTALDGDTSGSDDDKAKRKAKIEENKTKFRTLDDEHVKVVGVLDGLKNLAKIARDGKAYFQPAKDAGTQVSVLIQAKTAGTTDNTGNGATISYLVENKYGLQFFGGYTWSKLGDVKFRTVRNLAGDEVYEQVRDEEIEDFAVALGYSFYSFDHAKNYQLFGSIGTDVNDPGDRYYLGLGLLLWNRLAVVGGYATGIVEDGVNPDAAQADFYTTVKESREWEPYLGLSIRLYPLP